MVRFRRVWISRDHPDARVLSERRPDCRASEDVRGLCGRLRIPSAGRPLLRRRRRPDRPQANPRFHHPDDGRRHDADRAAADLRKHRLLGAAAAHDHPLRARLFRRRRVRGRLRLCDGACAAPASRVLRQLRSGFDVLVVRVRGGRRVCARIVAVARRDGRLGLAHPVSDRGAGRSHRRLSARESA